MPAQGGFVNVPPGSVSVQPDHRSQHRRCLRVATEDEDRAPVSIARLHLITPERSTDDVVNRVAAALAAGAPWVQVRTKRGTDQARLDHTAAVVAIVRAHGATAVVNDRADVALAAGAAGVHVGLDDLPVHAVRSFTSEGFLVGATVRNAEQARRAAGEGASYLGAGPVFATTTKTGLPDPMGLRGLAAITAAVDVPVIAVSGITVERVPGALDAGAHGVAVVGAVFAARDPAVATTAFLDALDPGGSKGVAGTPMGRPA
jgi:thiamine-phosphate pyrophosphorylase